MNQVLHLILSWTEDQSDPRPEHVAKIVRQPDGTLSLNLWLRGARPDGTPLPNRLSYTVPVQVGPADWPDPGNARSIRKWGLERIGPGVWVVSPSVWEPGSFHAYVVLRDVPEPAPFSD